MPEDPSNLFKLMEIGDRRINGINKKVIMIVGNVRSGKSCLYNWIVGNEMIGQDSVRGVKYINVPNNKLSAQIGKDITLTTLIPNCFNLDNQTTLLDMAGYNNANKYSQALAASYILKGVVEKAQEFKFLIAIGEQIFLDSTGRNLIKTFQGFLAMFNFSVFNPEIKAHLFSCISVLITRSRQPQNHIAYLNLILQRIRDPKLKLQNRELVMELVEHMINDNRVEPFELAIVSNSPKKCSLLNKLNGMGWQFIKVKQINSQIKASIVKISLQQEFLRLPQQEKEVYRKIIDQRVCNFTTFPYILKLLKNTFRSNWINLVQGISTTKTLSGNYLKQIFGLDNVFNQIESYLQKNDNYTVEIQEKSMPPKSYCSNIMSAISSIQKAYDISEKIADQQYCQFQGRCKQLGEFYSQLADCFKPFCRNRLQEQMVIRLKLTFVRGFREFFQLYNTYDHIAIVNNDMKDRCNSNMFEQTKQKYIQSFIKFMPFSLLSHLFTTIPQIQSYEHFFKQYKKKKADQYDPYTERNPQLNEYAININLVKADLYFIQGDKLKTSFIYIELLRQLSTECLRVDRFNDSYDFEAKLKNLYLMKLRAVQKLYNILASLDIKRYPTAKYLAIQLCQHFNEIDAVCQLYDSLLLDSKNKSQMCVLYQKYADYCIEWGRYPEAKVLLQKKLRLQNEDFEKRINTINAIYDLIVDENPRLRVAEQQKVFQLLGIFQDGGNVLDGLLGEIQNLITKTAQQKISDQKQKVIYQKKPFRQEEKQILHAYKSLYLDEQKDTHKPLIDKIEHIKLELELSDFEHFFNNTHTAIKQSLEKQSSSLSKYEQALKLPLDRQSGKLNQLTEDKFVQVFGKPYLSLFYRTAKVKIKTVKELVFMHCQNTIQNQIEHMQSRVSDGVNQLQRMVEQLEDSFVRIWNKSYFNRHDK